MTQSMAAITQLFYVNNWLHDWWYDSGFDEAAGNAQAEQLRPRRRRRRRPARGGAGRRPRGRPQQRQHVDADGRRVAAHADVPVDRPRYSSDARAPAAGAEGRSPASPGKFGPANFDVNRTARALRRRRGRQSDRRLRGADRRPAGKPSRSSIAATAPSRPRSRSPEAAGAVGVVIIDNVEAERRSSRATTTSTEDPTDPHHRPSPWPTGVALKAALEQAASRAHVRAWSSVERDGTIDNMIVAHEWGHYMHHRLVECGNIELRRAERGLGRLQRVCMMALREGDDLDGVYAGTTYANFDPAPGTSASAASRTPSTSGRTPSPSATSPTASRCRRITRSPTNGIPTARSTTPARCGRR
jgi:hypothetical protein